MVFQLTAHGSRFRLGSAQHGGKKGTRYANEKSFYLRHRMEVPSTVTTHILPPEFQQEQLQVSLLRSIRLRLVCLRHHGAVLTLCRLRATITPSVAEDQHREIDGVNAHAEHANILQHREEDIRQVQRNDLRLPKTASEQTSPARRGRGRRGGGGGACIR